jgi:hypothetical protein
MATQTNNLLLLDLTTGRHRTIDTGTPDDLEIGVDVALTGGANLRVNGNLIVEGTTTTTQSETVNIADNHLYLNDGYTTAVAQSAGIVTNYLPTATTDTVAATGFVAGVAATSNPTVNTTGAATFALGDLIQISGANEQANNGLFEVQAHAANVLTIKGVGTIAETVTFVQNQFVTDTLVACAITKVTVSVMQAGTDGAWETGQGDTTNPSFVFTDLSAGITLDGAYQNDGNTIATDAGSGDIVIAGSQKLQITATNGLDVDTIADFDVTTFDVQMTGTNGFSIDGTAGSNVTVNAGNLSLATTVSGDVLIDSVAGISIDGDTASNFSVTTGDLTLSTITSGTLAVTSAGTLDLDGVAVAIDATSGISIDAQALASNFSLATTGAAQDLTIALTGAQDSSLILSSTGTGGDALQITATAGGMDMNVANTTAEALTIKDAGATNYLTIDTNDVEVELTQFTNISVGAGIILTAGATLAAGELVAIDASGEAVLADSDTGTDKDAFVAGVSVGAVTATNPAQIYSVPGTLVPVLFGSAPAAANNGDEVFLSSIPGQATLTPPTGGGNVVFKVGILQGGDGADTTPLVLLQPKLVAVRP